MGKLTIEDLRGILIACAGGDDAELTGDIALAPFEDLGYDSLALIETSAQLKRDYGVVIPDELITEVRTPRQLLDLVNQQLAA
jgi:act minimal PKS acyl carrier protein